MFRLYRCLLYLYPPGYRVEFGREMLVVLRQGQDAAEGQSWVTRGWFCIREITGLMQGALREHLCLFAGCYPEDLLRLRRLNMRSEFRFPRSTAALMAVILAVVLVTIEKAKGIQLTYTAAGSEVMTIWSVLLSALAQMFLLVAIVAVIGWLIMFALGRTGVQRLSNVGTRAE
ncbi:MAG: hypothetical protein WB952_03570 [Terriglobales bacterium]